MLLQKLCQQMRHVQIRQFSTSVPEKINIPKPKVLRVAIDSWQKRHMKVLKKLLIERKISEASTYFYREVKSPNQHHYGVMLTAIGKIGHSQLAFKLLKEMRSRDFRPTSANLTSLFNACANDNENPKLALTHARSLYEQMALKGWTGTEITFHAMVKTFAIHGDTETCFKLIDEMVEKNLSITADTYNHLLMACVGDKKLGFVLAIRVLRQMIWNRIAPSEQCFNNLIRSAVECGCGDSVDALNNLLNDAKRLQLKDPKVELIESGANLLETKLDQGLVSIRAVPKNVNERLALIGGINGVLRQMSYFEVKPRSATYSLLLRCITSEQELLDFIKINPIYKLDTGFWNQLLKKCIVEKYECAGLIEKKLFESGKHFDIVTYGILAMRANTTDSVDKYLAMLEERGVVPNEIILSTLINNISRNYNMKTLFRLFAYCKDNDIPLNEIAVQRLTNMIDTNEKAGANLKIRSALKKIRIIKTEPNSRLKQFEPVVLKRNRSRWDEDTNDEEIEEKDKSLEEEARQTQLKNERRHRRLQLTESAENR